MTATYPSLWNHNAKNETRITCLPDIQLLVRQGMEEKAASIWSTASRAHLNLDFRYNSQPLGVAFTDHKSIGGRAWPNIVFTDSRFDYALAVWGNSTLGLLSHWWHSNRQQSGRGTTTISAVETLPVLDFRALSDDQLHHGGANLRRIPRQRVAAGLPGGRRPQPRPPRPPRRLRPLGLRQDKPTKASAASPPNGAPNPPSTAANPALRTPSCISKGLLH